MNSQVAYEVVTVYVFDYLELGLLALGCLTIIDWRHGFMLYRQVYRWIKRRWT